jgi:cytoskeletal protein RodZ
MRSALLILAGLLTGVLVAVGILAAFVFVGPDPVGLRPTPSASVAPSVVVIASPSVSPAASPSASFASPSLSPGPSSSVQSGSPSAAPGSPGASDATQVSLRVGQSPLP